MDRESILHELATWGTANTHRHGRDTLIRRAHTAGITKNKIHTLTGVSRPTIDKILKETPMQTTPTITPAVATWEMCDHWHPALNLPLAAPTRCPNLGDVIAVQVDGHTTGAVVTRQHEARIPGTTAHVLTQAGPSMPYGFASAEKNKDLIILSPSWVRNENTDHVKAGPMRTVCRRPLSVRQAYINAQDGSVRWDRVFRQIDAPDPAKVCSKCAEELARSAHHATHRFAAPEGAMYLSAETSDGDWDATGEWGWDITNGMRGEMVDKIHALLQEAAVLGYVEELPRPEDWVEGEEYDELQVRGVDDRLLVSFVIPNGEAWGWWADRLGLQKVADA